MFRKFFAFRQLMVVLLSVIASALLAEDYTVIVPSGETWTWAQAEAACGTATSGKRLVKAGPGILAPGADLSAKGFTELVVSAGVYDATALNQYPAVGTTITLTVASGATLRYGFSMTQTTYTINITVGGSGAPGEGGAIVFTASSPLGAKIGPNWILTADTVFYAKGTSRSVDFSCNAYGAQDSHNLFYMNGHALRIKGDSVGATATTSGPYIRFRSGPTFIQPGEIIFDNCRFTRYRDGGTRTWKSASDKTAAMIPCIKLVNGARCNFACYNDDQFLSSVACIDAEAGTEIGDMGVSTSDRPGTFTINKLIGSPKILGSGIAQSTAYTQEAYIKEYVARASDLAQGKMLTSVTNLYFKEYAIVSIDDSAALAQGVASVVASGTVAVVGSVSTGDDLAHHNRNLAVAVEGNDVKLAWTRERTIASDEFPVYVPAGLTYDWTQATNGLDVSGIAGKKLVKLGYGTLYSGNVAGAGCTELIVANGVYGVYDYRYLPINGTVMKVTVEDGATLKAVRDLSTLTTESHSLDLHLCGNGVLSQGKQLGAFCFWVTSGAANQYCNWTFDGDTLITIADTATQANFSCNGLSRSDSWNVWNMNGHHLTLRSITPNFYGLFRFRSGPTINNPGNITLDHARFSMYNGTNMKVNGNKLIPVFKTVNGCTVNFAARNASNTYLNKCVDICDFGPGTTMDNVTAHPTDTPGPTTISKLVGSVTVTTAQTLTVSSSYTVRKADLLADPPQILVAATNLTFASGCTLSVDDLSGLDLTAGVTIAKCPKGLLSGRPKRTGEFSVRAVTEGDYDCLKLVPRQGLMFIVR